MGAGCGSACLPFIVSTGAGGQGFGLVLCFRVVFPAFCPLSRLALGALLANMALFRVLRGFLEGFGVVVWVYVVLVVCVACGAFVRVWS